MSPVNREFKELLGLLNSTRVDFVIVGAYALAYHGVPRFTGDLDILIGPTPGNAARLVNALELFGFGSLGLTEADFLQPERVIQLGVAPCRVDFMTSITGVTWEEAVAGSVDCGFDGVPVRYLGRDELVRNKMATGRMKDLADVDALGLPRC